MPTTSTPTLKDIALATGVSIMTVSRVLRGAPKVAAEKRELVLKEAKRLDYQPDPHLMRMMQVVRGHTSCLPSFALRAPQTPFMMTR